MTVFKPKKIDKGKTEVYKTTNLIKSTSVTRKQKQKIESSSEKEEKLEQFKAYLLAHGVRKEEKEINELVEFLGANFLGEDLDELINKAFFREIVNETTDEMNIDNSNSNQNPVQGEFASASHDNNRFSNTPSFTPSNFGKPGSSNIRK